MTNTREGKRAYWAQHVNAWKASGETQIGYCRRYDLKLHQLTYWIQIFGGTAQLPSINSRAFIPVQMSAVNSAGLVLRLPNGLRVEGIDAGNVPVVRELLGCLT